MYPYYIIAQSCKLQALLFFNLIGLRFCQNLTYLQGFVISNIFNEAWVLTNNFSFFGMARKLLFTRKYQFLETKFIEFIACYISLSLHNLPNPPLLIQYQVSTGFAQTSIVRNRWPEDLYFIYHNYTYINNILFICNLKVF